MRALLKEPAVSRRMLVKVAGFTWALVGMFLFYKGSKLISLYDPISYLILAAAIMAGTLKSRFTLSKLARVNISRIKALTPHKERICVFAFQANQSYILVAVMATLGYLLRTSGLPPLLLAWIYMTIGTSLFSASRSYLIGVSW